MEKAPTRILCLYYSQSGQLRRILDRIIAGMDNVSVTYREIEPVTPFPFPWTSVRFFDAMPEGVKSLPAPVRPVAAVDEPYDWVLFGYQPWFLHPSQPVAAFLQSEDAKKLLGGKQVVTVIGSRNMWLNAQEHVKKYLIDAGATLRGNVVLADRYPNIISTITVIRWAFTGRKEATRWFPAAGVQEDDIEAAIRFGKPVSDAVQDRQGGALQEKLLEAGAVELNPGLVLLEQQGVKTFRFWADYIRRKGGPGDPARIPRLNQFKRLLFTGIFILSPITSLLAKVKLQLQKKRLVRDVRYFQQLDYEPNRI